MNFYSLYRCHDYHFKVYGAMFLGQFEPALAAADELIATMPEDAAADRLAADGRLGRGLRADAAARADPVRQVAGDHRRAAARPTASCTARPRRCCTTPRASPTPRSATWRRPRPAARCSRAAARACRRARYLFNNTCLDILAIAERDAGRRDRVPPRRPRRRLRPPARGGGAGRRPAVRRAVGLDAADPPRAGRAAAGAGPRRGGRGGLSRRPRARRHAAAGPASTPTTSGACTASTNACSALGKTSEAAIIKPRLDLALARATVPVKASCYCRMSHAA